MQVLRLTAGALVLYLVLILPNHPNAMTWSALRLFPLELPVILLLMLALPARNLLTGLIRTVLVAVLMLVTVLKLADYATFIAYNRSFNPVTDMGLIDASWRLGSGAVGVPLALLAVIGALLALALLAGLLWWATGQWARIAPPFDLKWQWHGGFALLTLLAATIAIGQMGHSLRWWQLPLPPPGSAFTARLGYERAIGYRATLRDLIAFTEAAQNDPFDGATPLLDQIGGRDVLIAFVESYGRASFDNELYAPTHVGTLREAEALLAENADIAMRSGWLTAPMTGGQSWLAHNTIASGLWISNQTRYRTLLVSPRKSLYQLATEAGYHSAAVMPAITLDWPEGARAGFETILAADDLEYAGQPFNWVTMPDQYTLATFDRLLVDPPRDRPLFTQIALISSHAPWVPVPEMLPWEDVGDGTVYDEVALSGDPPNVVWQDRDRVREQYRLAVDYALQAITGYAVRKVDDMPLMIILGDHQSAGFVAQSESFDVAVHMIGPAEIVAQIDEWGWTEGLVPADDAPVWPMDQFRNRFLSAFSSGGPDID